MDSLWNHTEAEEAVQRTGDRCSRAVALRLYTAGLIGRDDSLVLHGGGNVSVKETRRLVTGEAVESLHIKASGRDLAGLGVEGLCALELGPLRALRSLDTLADEAMVNELRRARFDTNAPTPSIETLVHAFLPHAYVDHSHADALLAITNRPDGRRLVRDALGERVAIVDYVRPGLDLAKAVADCLQADADVEGIVLLHHGLITFGDDARSSYERHIELVDACEAFLRKRDIVLTAPGRTPGREPPTARTPSDAAAALASRIAPVMRELLAIRTGDEDRPYRPPLLDWRGDDELLGLIQRRDIRELIDSGPLTGDHLIRTGPVPLLLDGRNFADEDAFLRQLKEAVEAYRREYAVNGRARDDDPSSSDVHGCGRAMGRSNDPTRLDPAPRVVLLPDAGLFAWGATKQQARICADIAERTLRVKAASAALGPHAPLPREHWRDMEVRPFQRAKLGPGDHEPLSGMVVAISGGAGAIGLAVAEECARAGAHVAVCDLPGDRLDAAVARIRESYGPYRALGVVLDVTDETSVRDGFAIIARTFGGVDVIVPNAGIAHVSPIDELRTEDFRRVMEVNATGYLNFMREGVVVLKRQNLGGHVIINASKNVFGPGKDFGAYSASKAAGHQLGKVAAIELAPSNIRVNMINADAIFGDEGAPSGLWATVGPARAASRGLSEAELPEYYRGRNLLKARMRGEHVGRAVVFFASGATPTTGATLPVDGGVVEAFPR